MNKNIKFALIFTFLFAIFGIKMNAQVKKGDLIDGIVVVVGDEIILESDIDLKLYQHKDIKGQIDNFYFKLPNSAA